MSCSARPSPPLRASSARPISRSHSLSLSCPQVPAALGARKKVSLSNPYSYDTVFSFYTDQPHLLHFKSPTQAIPAGETRYIGLSFAALPANGRHSPGETKLLVFVNNDEDKNEECMEVTVVYT